MGRAEALSVVRDRVPGRAFGVSWLTSPVLTALASDRDAGREDEVLERVARALECDLVFVDADEPWAPQAAQRLASADVAVAWAVTGVLGRLAAERGLSDVLRATAADPGSLAFPLDRALHDVLDSVRAGIRAGADAVVIADDLAGASGWMVSPDYALDALVPCYQRAAVIAVHEGLVPVFHSDGDVRALYPALADSGFAGVHMGGAGSEAIDAASPAARRAGLSLLGGVKVAALAREGARHMGERLASVADRGALVICDDGGVSVPSEVAMISSVFDAVRQAHPTESGE